MATVTVNLSEEAFERLNKWKKTEEESLSNVILRVLPKQRTAEEIDEILRESEIFLTDEEADKMLKDIE
jgi:predicted CopG family antitoxin